MQARTETVTYLNEMIALLSALGAFGVYLAMSFLQATSDMNFTTVEKLFGASLTASVLFFLLRWSLKRNDKQAERIDQINELRLQESKEVIKELKEILKAKQD